MMLRYITFACLSLLLLQTVTAQFGLGGRKKPGFEDLKKQAEDKKKPGASAAVKDAGTGQLNMAEMQDMWAEALKDPETLKAMEEMGEQFGTAMEDLANMTPEQLQKQMEDAMEMFTSGSMVDTIIEQREEVLAELERSGTVPPEELARYKADPAYFELKMRESFDQMAELMNDPKLMEGVMEGMAGVQNIMGDPSNAMGNMLGEVLGDDEQIEKARLELLSGANPALSAMFESEEMQDILKDPKKFRDTVKEGAGIKDEL